jgi:molecular chaperone GrpE
MPNQKEEVKNEDIAKEVQNSIDASVEENTREAVLGSNDMKITALEGEIADLKDQYLRKIADFENFRKRMNREKQDAIDFANQSLLFDLVQVMDDFERALKSAEMSNDFQSFYEGVSMIEKQLSSQLENKWDLKRFDSVGALFDPNRHEALMVEKSTEVNETTVAEDLVKGYTLKDRVIRAAKVKVIMPEA